MMMLEPGAFSLDIDWASVTQYHHVKAYCAVQQPGGGTYMVKLFDGNGSRLYLDLAPGSLWHCNLYLMPEPEALDLIEPAPDVFATYVPIDIDTAPDFDVTFAPIDPDATTVVAPTQTPIDPAGEPPSDGLDPQPGDPGLMIIDVIGCPETFAWIQSQSRENLVPCNEPAPETTITLSRGDGTVVGEQVVAGIDATARFESLPAGTGYTVTAVGTNGSTDYVMECGHANNAVAFSAANIMPGLTILPLNLSGCTVWGLLDGDPVTSAEAGALEIAIVGCPPEIFYESVATTMDTMGCDAAAPDTAVTLSRNGEVIAEHIVTSDEPIHRITDIPSMTGYTLTLTGATEPVAFVLDCEDTYGDFSSHWYGPSGEVSDLDVRPGSEIACYAFAFTGDGADAAPATTATGTITIELAACDATIVYAEVWVEDDVLGCDAGAPGTVVTIIDPFGNEVDSSTLTGTASHTFEALEEGSAYSVIAEGAGGSALYVLLCGTPARGGPTFHPGNVAYDVPVIANYPTTCLVWAFPNDVSLDAGSEGDAIGMDEVSIGSSGSGSLTIYVFGCPADVTTSTGSNAADVVTCDIRMNRAEIHLTAS